MNETNVQSKGGANPSSARQKWESGWSHYIKISVRHSSSAVITAENFIKKAQLCEGAKILDLGCGHGRITELLIERVPSLNVVGVDMTRSLLDSFIVRSGANKSKIQLMCADITRLPLEDDTFDAVISSRVFQYLPDPLLGMREALRVLKPGGSLVISIPNKLNLIRYFTYDQQLYSPFEVRDWFMECEFENIEFGSMCFFPPSRRFKKLAFFFEIATRIPIVKYLGGNVLVRGRKKAQTNTG
jgi:SAM-dependent methyltransferase